MLAFPKIRGEVDCCGILYNASVRVNTLVLLGPKNLLASSYGEFKNLIILSNFKITVKMQAPLFVELLCK